MCICYRERRVYPSDVTDAEWAILEPLIPPALPQLVEDNSIGAVFCLTRSEVAH